MRTTGTGPNKVFMIRFWELTRRSPGSARSPGTRKSGNFSNQPRTFRHNCWDCSRSPCSNHVISPSSLACSVSAAVSTNWWNSCAHSSMSACAFFSAYAGTPDLRLSLRHVLRGQSHELIIALSPLADGLDQVSGNMACFIAPVAPALQLQTGNPAALATL